MTPLTADTVDARAEAPAAWLADLRARGREAFTRMPMPTSVEEVWRYVDLDFSLDDLSLPDAPGPALAESRFAVESAGRVRIIDGAVNMVGMLSKGLGWGVSMFQTGTINTYAFILTVGVLAILGVTLM